MINPLKFVVLVLSFVFVFTNSALAEKKPLYLNGTVKLLYFQDPGYRVWSYNSDTGVSCLIRVERRDLFQKVVELANVCRNSSSLS